MLLEREGDLEALAALLERVPDDGGRVALIRGEAGVGKTALAAEFARRSAPVARVLVGTCDDLTSPEPLGPMWDVARDVPGLSEPLKVGDRMGVLRGLLDVLSDHTMPTVLVLEDTQWADDATLDAISYVGRRIARTNGLVLLTCRDGEIDYEHPLRHVVGGLDPSTLTRLHLPALSKAAVTTMIGDRLLDVDRIFELTAGNPLFVRELLEAPAGQIPSSVQDSVVARAAKLSTRARATLDQIAVVPGGVERVLLDILAGPTAEQLAECSRQGLLDVGSEVVAFRHELARQAIESVLDPSRRRAFNQRVLEALEPMQSFSRLVHHAREAADVETIVRVVPLAASRALELGSYREARALFRLLEPHLGRVPAEPRARMLEGGARIERFLDQERSIELIEKAIEIYRDAGDDHALARTLTIAARAYPIDRAAAVADEAIAVLATQQPCAELAFALSVRGAIASEVSHYELALEFAGKALEMAEQVDDELSEVHALTTIGTVRYAQGRDDGRELLEDACRRAEKAGLRYEELRGLSNLGSCALSRMELDLATEYARRMLNVAVRYEIPVFIASSQQALADVMLLGGDWAQAEDLATEALATNFCTKHSCLVVVGRIQARQSRPGAREALACAWSLIDGTGAPAEMIPAAAAIAEYAWITDARSVVPPNRLRELVRDATGADIAWTRGDLAWWLWKAGEIDPVPDDLPEPHRLATSGQAAEAANMFDRLGLPYERAIALFDAGRDGQHQAIEILETLGAVAVAAKFRRELRAAGLPLPRGRSQATRRHRAGLTGRQAEVLALLDVGLSNSEIADRLYISPKTVEHHVSAILLKLDTPTRDAAVHAARDAGMLLG